MHNDLTNQNHSSRELRVPLTAEQLERRLVERARDEFEAGRANFDTIQLVVPERLIGDYSELAALPARTPEEYAQRTRAAVAMSFLHEQETFQDSEARQVWHDLEQQRFGYTTEVVETPIVKGQVQRFHNNGSPVIIKTRDVQGMPDEGTLFISPEDPMSWRVHRLEHHEYSSYRLDFRDVTPSSPQAVVTVESTPTSPRDHMLPSQISALVTVGPDGALYVRGQSDTPVNTEQVQLFYSGDNPLPSSAPPRLIQ